MHSYDKVKRPATGAAVRLLAVCVPGALLVSCIIVPFPVVPEEHLFAEEKIQFIRPALTTRIEVEEAFGEPVFARKDGNLAVYGQARTVAAFFAAVMPAGGGTGPIEKHSELLIHYDDSDVVTRVDLIEGRQACTEDGICVDSLYEWQYSGELIEREGELTDIVITSSGEEDRSAKQFEPILNGCRVFLYSSGSAEFLRVEIPEIGKTSLANSGYLTWTREPGPILIVADANGIQSESTLDCVSESTIFVNLHVRSWYTLDLGPHILPVEEDAGRTEVIARSLILH